MLEKLLPSQVTRRVTVVALVRREVPLLTGLQARIQDVGLEPIFIARIFEALFMRHAERVAAQNHSAVVKPALVHVLVAHALVSSTGTGPH